MSDQVYSWRPGGRVHGYLMRGRSPILIYLPGEDPTDPDDHQDVENSGSHDGADSQVPFGDKHAWIKGNKKEPSIRWCQSIGLPLHQLETESDFITKQSSVAQGE